MAGQILRPSANFCSTTKTRNLKKIPANVSWRYRWNEETHDEVLAGLLNLDQKHHQQEIIGGLSRQKFGKPKPKKGDRSARKVDTESLLLFDR
jgi:hypothetical protein